jgi:ABC-type polysaccharide/polyol phosphate transport system ATPase subunit
MDSVTHTLIATALMFLTYLLGRYLGFKKGEEEGTQNVMMLFMLTLGVTRLEINEENKSILAFDEKGNKKYLKLSTRK